MKFERILACTVVPISVVFLVNLGNRNNFDVMTIDHAACQNALCNCFTPFLSSK